MLERASIQVMELLEGPDLFDFLAERSSKLEEVKAVGLVRPADRCQFSNGFEKGAFFGVTT